MMRYVSHQGERVSEPTSFLVAAGVVAAVAIPFVMKIVPPNRFFGLRAPQTLSNQELWFRVNRFAGWALLVAAALSGSVFVLEPEFASGRSFLGLLIFVVPLVAALGASIMYVRRVAKASEAH
jgi:uncharacterized membrane protein